MPATKLLDIAHQPRLGRVHAVNRKHRLRAKHYASIADWPASGASVEVLPGASLDGVDHFPSIDEVLIVSDRLLAVLRGLEPALESFPLDAGGRTVHLILPVTESDVCYESDGAADYSESGYQVVDGHNLRAQAQPEAIFCNVRNTRLLAIADRLVAAAADAGVVWQLHDAIARYPLTRPHPYSLLHRSFAAITVERLEPSGEWPTIPAAIPHPLGRAARDENFESDPDRAWLELCTKLDDPHDAALARYCSGLPLPPLTGVLDERLAKSKLAKRWKDTLTCGFGSLVGIPCVSASVRDQLLAAAVAATFPPVVVTDTKLDKTMELYRVDPTVVVDWIDWSRSDVGLRWNGMLDEVFDLQPSEASYAATQLLVRVAGSNLVLIHEQLAPLLAEVVGLTLVPLTERLVARNLDDCFRVS